VRGAPSGATGRGRSQWWSSCAKLVAYRALFEREQALDAVGLRERD
jgi:hypothetical protein